MDSIDGFVHTSISNRPKIGPGRRVRHTTQTPPKDRMGRFGVSDPVVVASIWVGLGNRPRLMHYCSRLKAPAGKCAGPKPAKPVQAPDRSIDPTAYSPTRPQSHKPTGTPTQPSRPDPIDRSRWRSPVSTSRRPRRTGPSTGRARSRSRHRGRTPWRGDTQWTPRRDAAAAGTYVLARARTRWPWVDGQSPPEPAVQSVGLTWSHPHPHTSTSTTAAAAAAAAAPPSWRASSRRPC